MPTRKRNKKEEKTLLLRIKIFSPFYFPPTFHKNGIFALRNTIVSFNRCTDLEQYNAELDY